MGLRLLFVLLAAPALAQSPASVLDPDACGAYTALDTEARIGMLRTIQPFGDDIDAADQGAAQQWASEVAAACAGHPERPLADAARTALGIE